MSGGRPLGIEGSENGSVLRIDSLAIGGVERPIGELVIIDVALSGVLARGSGEFARDAVRIIGVGAVAAAEGVANLRAVFANVNRDLPSLSFSSLFRKRK